MNTDTQNADSATALEAGEKQVRDFLTSVVRKLQTQLNMNRLVSVGVEVDIYQDGGDRVAWTTYADGGKHRTSPRLETAFNEQIINMAPEALARLKREEAAKLLSEAEQLDTAARTQPEAQP